MQPAPSTDLHDRSPLGGLSHVQGARQPPLSEHTISQWLDATAARFPQGLACVFREQSIRWTWQQLRDAPKKR